MKIPALFEPITINGLTISNRIWVSPMCQYSAQDGRASRWHEIHLGSFAAGGAGLVLVEATAVVPEGRISIGCTGIWNDELAAAFIPIIDFAHEMKIAIGIQVAHAGRKGSTMLPWDDHLIADPSEGGWTTVAPSPLAYPGHPVPHELTVAEIHGLIQNFAEAAKRSVEVGFDVIEIHAAHGYLLHEFLSPITNQRADAYGGGFEGRTRFLREVVVAIREVIPDTYPVFVRISATDWVVGGWDLEGSIQLAKILKELGVDLLDVSTGGLVSDAEIESSPGYQVKFASDIRASAGIACSAVGLITDANQANAIIESAKADAVMAARQFLRNPRWALQIADELGFRIDIPIQIERGRRIR
jgi:2,4-dienoyl-CoA reductase-like NADH-dependent reductase (Old Yellow Enzyme family)